MTERSVEHIVTKTGKSAAEARAHLEGASPLGRLFEPEEVARAIAFLLRPESGGITGSTVDVDGGELAG